MSAIMGTKLAAAPRPIRICIEENSHSVGTNAAAT